MASYVINNPSNSFFFALPADLELAGGYIIYLTDSNDNICSKAYNGKKFEKATTTRVDIEFAAPKVTLGTPMTSYSYYLNGNISKANECTNNVIYFPTATTISNLQNAMIADYGYVVDGVTYGKKDVTYYPETKSFNKSQGFAVTSWGAKKIKAYVETKDGKRYYSNIETVQITGLPYVAAPPTEAAGWTKASWNVAWKDSYVQLGGVSGSREASITSPAFNDLPKTINTQFVVDTKIAAFQFALWYQTTFKLYSGGTTVISQDSGKQSGKDFYLTGNGSLSNGSTVKLQSTYEAAGPYVQVRSLKILYR